MLKITGLDKLQRQLSESRRALSELDGQLGSVSFDPHDPASIESAIQSVNHMVDARVGAYASNAIVSPLIEQMKEAYRDKLLAKAAAARLKSKDNE